MSKKVETKEERIARWAQSKITIYVVTEKLNWGKGATIQEALKNAKWKRSETVAIELFSCSPNNVDIYDNGIGLPENTVTYTLTGDKPIQKI